MPEKRILITGGTGMIGLNLLGRLRLNSADTLVVTHRAPSRLERLPAVAGNARLMEMDLDQPGEIEAVIAKVRPNVVFHLGSTIWSQVPPHESDRHYRTNVMGTHALLEALCRHSPDARLVFTGSSAAYGAGVDLCEDDLPAPNTVYGASKAAVTVLLQTYARLYDLDTVELRLFTPFGPYEGSQRLIPYVIGQLLSGRDVELTAGVQQRDFVYVDDVVAALLKAAAGSVPRGEVINIAGGNGVSVGEVAEELLCISGRSDVKLRFGAVPQREDEMFQMSANIDKARRMLDWQPTVSWQEGLRQCWQWFQRRPSSSLV